MKHKAGRPRKPQLHQPVKELAEAEAMPPRKRRKKYNAHHKEDLWADLRAGWPGYGSGNEKARQ